MQDEIIEKIVETKNTLVSLCRELDLYMDKLGSRHGWKSDTLEDLLLDIRKEKSDFAEKTQKEIDYRRKRNAVLAKLTEEDKETLGLF